MYKQLSAPLSAQVELTMACGNNCIHCYNHCKYGEHRTDNLPVLSRELMEIILKQLVGSRVFRVTLTGGEPLIEFENLIFMMRYLADHGIFFSINSSATLLNKEKAEKLYLAGCRSMLISICGPNKEVHDSITSVSGSFEATIHGMKNAVNAGINVSVNMATLVLNHDKVVETGLLAKKLGARSFYSTKVAPPVTNPDFRKETLSGEQVIDTLDSLNILRLQHGMNVGTLSCYPMCLYVSQQKYPFLAGRSCSGGITGVAIGADGSVRACVHSDKSYGKIQNEGLMISCRKMKEWRNGKLLPLACKNCSYVFNCTGGCRIDSISSEKCESGLDINADVSRIGQIDALKVSLPSLCGQEIFKVSFFWSRKERFGAACTPHSGGRMVFLTNDTVKMLRLFEGKTSSFDAILKYTGLSFDETTVLCQELLWTGLLQK